MFNNAILFAHKAGQLLNGVQKTPGILKNFIKPNIKIHNCYDQFIVDDTIIYGRVKSQYIDLHVYEDTIIRIPKNLIQLEGDTISIQYVDVFSSRCSSMYKYKGIDNGFVLRLHKILNGNMSQENIESAISIGRHLIAQ